MIKPSSENHMHLRNRFDENIRDGIFELLILQALLDQDRKCHELHREIGVRTDGVFCRTRSLHMVLLRLILQGFVSSKFSQQDGMQTQVVYHIEESGKEYLAYGRIHLEHIMEGLSMFFGQEEKPQS